MRQLAYGPFGWFFRAVSSQRRRDGPAETHVFRRDGERRSKLSLTRRSLRNRRRASAVGMRPLDAGADLHPKALPSGLHRLHQRPVCRRQRCVRPRPRVRPHRRGRERGAM